MAEASRKGNSGEEINKQNNEKIAFCIYRLITTKQNREDAFICQLPSGSSEALLFSSCLGPGLSTQDCPLNSSNNWNK